MRLNNVGSRHIAGSRRQKGSGSVSPVAELLLVEDDAEIRRALMRALVSLGHVVTSAETGMSALQAIIDTRPDLVVIDLGLPDVDGEDLLRMIRSVSQVPIVVATARGGEDIIVKVLEYGADDYVIKPFGPAQLDARIRAVLRRTAAGSAGSAQPVVIGELRLDHAAHEVTLVVTVAGKVRDKVTVDAGLPESAALEAAMKSEKVRAALNGRGPSKVIYVQDRLINLVP